MRLLFSFIFFSILFSQDFIPDIQRIVDKGTLVVSLYFEDFPPFFMKDKNGELIGSDIDIAKGLAENLGVKLEFIREAKTFDEVASIVAKGRADIAISYLSGTTERAKKVLFTHPYLWLNDCLLLNRSLYSKVENKKDFLKALDTPTYSLAVLKESIQSIHANYYFPNITKIYCNTYQELIDAVDSGKVIISYVDEVTARILNILQPHKILNIQTVSIKDTIDPICIAVSWKNQFFCEWVKRYLEWNKINYKIDELLEKYKEELKSDK